jgi:hypothetical protein
MKARNEKQREKDEREADERREAEDRERNPASWAAGLRKHQEVSVRCRVSLYLTRVIGYHQQDKRQDEEKGRPQ